MARAAQLLSCRQAGRTRTYDGDFLAGLKRWRKRFRSAVDPRALGDRKLDRADRDRIVVDPKHAGALARRGAKRAGEFGKVVGFVQPLDRLVPAAAENEIVPIGNDVAERATLVTKRNAAVHAACALLLQLLLGIRPHDLIPVMQALPDRAVRLFRAFELDETSGVTHAPLPSPPALQAHPFRVRGEWLRALVCSPSE